MTIQEKCPRFMDASPYPGKTDVIGMKKIVEFG
jgi:hypothetical protein